MRSFNFALQVARPKLMLLSGLSTWVVAMLSNGPYWFTTPKLASPLTIVLTVFGASLYHFGAANTMYTRKSETLSISRLTRWSLIVLGSIGMGAAVSLAFSYLSTACQLIVIFDVAILMAYAGVLSRHWLSKNLLMAIVCISPILLGWFAGYRLNPNVPYGIAVTFFAYLAREIVKDIQDRRANCGYRHTLPLWLGVDPARRIAAGVLAVALVILVIFGIKLWQESWYVYIPYLLVWKHLAKVAYCLICYPGGNEVAESEQIFLGSCWLMLTFFSLIF